MENKYLKNLYNVSMGRLMKEKALTHGRFFTNEEFEKNKKEIFDITYPYDKLREELNSK